MVRCHNHGIAGAGAILTPVSTVRALAGSAAIVSGMRAEFNQEFFANLATQVITQGITQRRKDIYDRIVKQQARKIEGYPVEAAVKDAISYHSSCSILTGLEQASESIKLVDDPGLLRLNNLLAKSGLSRRITIGRSGLSIVRAVKLGRQLNVLEEVGKGQEQAKASADGYKRLFDDEKDKQIELLDNLKPADIAKRKSKLAEAITAAREKMDKIVNAADTEIKGKETDAKALDAELGVILVEIAKAVNDSLRAISEKKLLVQQAKVDVLEAEIRKIIQDTNEMFKGIFGLLNNIFEELQKTPVKYTDVDKIIGEIKKDPAKASGKKASAKTTGEKTPAKTTGEKTPAKTVGKEVPAKAAGKVKR